MLENEKQNPIVFHNAHSSFTVTVNCTDQIGTYGKDGKNPRWTTK